jgi:hypothetical protein
MDIMTFTPQQARWLEYADDAAKQTAPPYREWFGDKGADFKEFLTKQGMSPDDVEARANLSTANSTHAPAPHKNGHGAKASQAAQPPPKKREVEREPKAAAARAPKQARAPDPAPLYRTAPHNIEAEQALLGAILVNNEAYYRVSDFLEPRHFFEPAHQRIFELAGTLIRDGRIASPVTLKDFLPADVDIGGLTLTQYLARLAAEATTVVNAPDYARTIADLATRRSLIVFGEDIVNMAFDAPVDFSPRTMIEDSECRLNELAQLGHDQQRAGPLIQSSAQFLRDFVPPDYLIVGVVQRRYFYSLTARTGDGKTAILLLFAAHVALGRALGDRQVPQGRVLYFAGENPDDIRMRWIAMAQNMDFDPDAIDVHFIPGRFTISKMLARIKREAAAIGEFALIIIDTSAAYFEGDEENSNVDLGAHARMLRSLTTIVPGGPTVIAACHPPKNAPPDNLIPRGGGAYIAEVDGNLTCVKADSSVEMHWQGKFRGPDFAPVAFRLETKTHQLLKDTGGRLVPTVIASHLSTGAQEEIAAAALNDENRLLQAIADDPDVSRSMRARTLDWLTHAGEPHKKKVERLEIKLAKAKLIRIERGGRTVILKAGLEFLERITSPRRQPSA